MTTPERKANRWSTDQNNNENLTTYKSNVNVNLAKSSDATAPTSPASSGNNSSNSLNNNKVTVKGSQRWETPSSPTSTTAPNQASSNTSSNILGLLILFDLLSVTFSMKNLKRGTGQQMFSLVRKR